MGLLGRGVLPVVVAGSTLKWVWQRARLRLRTGSTLRKCKDPSQGGSMQSEKLTRRTGVEPATTGSTVRYSDQLSYRPFDNPGLLSRPSEQPPANAAHQPGHDTTYPWLFIAYDVIRVKNPPPCGLAGTVRYPILLREYRSPVRSRPAPRQGQTAGTCRSTSPGVSCLRCPNPADSSPPSARSPA